MAAIGDIFAGCAIAATVSIDVAALTTAKYAGKDWNLRTAAGWAALNAAWHGGLLAFYLLFISGIFSIFQGFASYLLSILETLYFSLPFVDLKAILTTILEHFQTYGSVFLLFLVWFAYRGKVVSIPGEARLEDAPPWWRWFWRRVSGLTSSGVFRANFQAFIVAIDMLALAALIKGSSSSAQPLDQAILVAQVLVIVFVVCVGAFYLTTTALQGWLAGHADSSEIQFWIFLNLRLLEPLLIFFFLMEAIAYLATGLAIGNAAMFIGAGFLVAALIQSVGMRPILEAVRASMPVEVK